MSHFFQDLIRRSAPVATIAFLSVAFVGCERKEKVLDIETPNRSIEVERSRDTGEVDVEVERND